MTNLSGLYSGSGKPKFLHALSKIGKFLFEAPRRLYIICFPKVYIRQCLAKEYKKQRIKRAEAAILSRIERQNLEAEFQNDTLEYELWQTSIEDEELVRRARKMDIFLEDISAPPQDDKSVNVHYVLADYCYILLHHQSRELIAKQIRERTSVFRKERRERIEFYVKCFTGIIAAITGLVGASIGLYSVLNK